MRGLWPASGQAAARTAERKDQLAQVVVLRRELVPQHVAPDRLLVEVLRRLHLQQRRYSSALAVRPRPASTECTESAAKTTTAVSAPSPVSVYRSPPNSTLLGRGVCLMIVASAVETPLRQRGPPPRRRGESKRAEGRGD